MEFSTNDGTISFAEGRLEPGLALPDFEASCLRQRAKVVKGPTPETGVTYELRFPRDWWVRLVFREEILTEVGLMMVRGEKDVPGTAPEEGPGTTARSVIRRRPWHRRERGGGKLRKELRKKVAGREAQEHLRRQWIERLESVRKARHDGWLQSEVGSPPYVYEWGNLESRRASRPKAERPVAEITVEYW